MSDSLQPAPRKVGFAVRTGALFGGFINQFGWAFFAFSLIFVWIFSLETLSTQLRFNHPLQTAQARIIEVRYASAKENKVKVYAHEFAFQYQGKNYTAVSYATGQELPLKTPVSIEFNPENPETARMTQAGFRATTFHSWVAYPVLFFPIAGLLVWGAGFKRGLKILKLLKNGKLTTARLISQKETGAVVKTGSTEAPIYQLIFGYEVHGKSFETALKTHEIEAITDQSLEEILYLPENPANAYLVDAIPGKLLREQGLFQSTQPFKNLLALALPLLSAGMLLLMVLSLL
ncbi:hypothetical protein COW36_17555 [bacterium (Candidatus Blackallbacteria) CG17_big_fil_post_rev_8_21_14_2_50_48_46]|uniref:DUF3592 domain-containing protein n=1 Tax=bacterium (Candidatus Blackallbacteria) CG17_big_fil_post_rev_8_21_14_2_50_48_46 TaxID=2014261 RepID=A0A2M7G0I3_9BACT|nr:MAG: hypothetical protein COW64_01175 [bacterium (Candidatus Blackallbacteria) CG18_big_fil_WC_8_21_14_2_50_49_26]PIW15228.1 MAG: hypothetical protein COW36_17555 [bacterium (Candidatus Blackallbacteria) CG17_big_fil_post_rev_8_21_14_2_50_48_46]PIW44815.1 MAG: hypothetical protein COW20_22890 [bacterium (Candidatus Blackallbacteria) CG13_big_fil_rev_8_21_14_2_50_49_14]